MHVPSLTSGMARIRLCFWLAALLTAGVWAALLVRAHQASRTPGAQAVPGQALMGGMALTNTPAPDFTLTNQFGQQVSLRQERGKVVFLAFVDSQCMTICPLTTQSLVDALQLLGPAASQVALLGVNANPQAATVADVRDYSQAHGLLQRWNFSPGHPRSSRPSGKPFTSRHRSSPGRSTIRRSSTSSTSRDRTATST